MAGLTWGARGPWLGLDDQLPAHETTTEPRGLIWSPAYCIALPAGNPFSEICMR